jgi:hypothetical protein
VTDPQRRRSLDDALRAMAEDDGRLGASAAVEERLLTEVRAIAAARRRRAAMAACAVAAAVMLALWMTAQRFVPARPNAVQVAEVTTEFMPLDYSSVPSTNLQVVRLAVPRAALASFGLGPLEAMDRTAGETVLADVLVGDDGLARAVRFVRPAADQEQMP